MIFDIETDGLLDSMTKIHSLVIRDALNPAKFLSFADQPGYRPIAEGIAMLESVDEVIGHNIIAFDIPAIQLLYPNFRVKHKTDTLVLAGLIYPNVEEKDYTRRDFPKRLIGSQSLKAWGYRLGLLKGSYSEETDWQLWTPDMQEYCELDTAVTYKLWALLDKANWSPVSTNLEMRFAELMSLQERNGFGFNEERAQKLFSELSARRDELTRSLQQTFKPRVQYMKTVRYYIDPESKERYRVKGDAPSKIRNRLKPGPFKEKHIPFNPGSRPEAAERLIELGWKPDEFTKTGKPKVDDETLGRCDIPQAAELAQFYTISKVIGMLGDGQNAWLKLSKHGRIHGRVIPYGTVTGRCSHTKPNVAQTPSVTIKKIDGVETMIWGEEAGWSTDCRALWGPTREGWWQVGADASGLELRCLGHFLSRYDDGLYAELVADKTRDVHISNRDTFGLEPTKEGRGKSKTGIYGLIYGAGDEKLGQSLGPLMPQHEKAARSQKIPAWALRSMAKRGPVTRERKINYLRGSYARERMFKGLAGYENLSAAVTKVVESRGWLKGLDGRRLRVRKKHAALNTLLQSAGALLVKMATVIMYDKLVEQGLVFGEDWALMAHIHDEVQVEARTEEIAHIVGRTFVEALKEAGIMFGFRCALDGEYKIGRNWAETH